MHNATRSAVALATTTLLLLFLAPGARGQVAWDAPLLLGPNSPAGLGIHLTDPAPGAGIGAMATWRGSPAPGGIGLRAGVAEGFGDDLAFFGGADVSGYLLRADEEMPVDILWVTGAGLGVGDYVLVSFPLGVSVGRTFSEEGLGFTPYASPRLVLDGHLGRDEPAPGGSADDSELDLGFVVDVGADLDFGTSWTIRFGASLGDHEALSIGMVFPTN